jgi:hypothetical protein
MTIALCLACGARKFGAFNPCDDCLWMPYTDEDRARCVMMSDHHFREAQLAEYGDALRKGTELQLPQEVVDRTAAMMKDLPMETALPVVPGQDALRRVIEELSSLAHTRERYLGALHEPGKMLVDDVQFEAVEPLRELTAKEHPECQPFYLRLIVLPNVGLLSLYAIKGLCRPSPRVACDRIAALSPGERRCVVKGVRRLAAMAKGGEVVELSRLLDALTERP